MDPCSAGEERQSRQGAGWPVASFTGPRGRPRRHCCMSGNNLSTWSLAIRTSTYHPSIFQTSPRFLRIGLCTVKMGSLSTFAEDDVIITSFEVTDLRFPTSLDGVGSDAMHVGTNGSHPFIQLKTNHDGLVGEGIVSCSCYYSASIILLTRRMPGLQQWARQRADLHGSGHLRPACCWKNDAPAHS